MYKSFCLSANGNDNTNSNSVIFIIKDTTLSLLSLYQQSTIKSCPTFWPKYLKGQCIGMNVIKQKVRIKRQQTSIDKFSNQTL